MWVQGSWVSSIPRDKNGGCACAMRNPAHYSRIMLVHVLGPLLCRHNVRKPSCARLSCKRTTLLPHLALEREVWSFVHEYGRNCIHNIGGAVWLTIKHWGGSPQSPPPPSSDAYANVATGTLESLLRICFPPTVLILAFIPLLLSFSVFSPTQCISGSFSVFHIFTEDGWLYSS